MRSITVKREAHIWLPIFPFVIVISLVETVAYAAFRAPFPVRLEDAGQVPTWGGLTRAILSATLGILLPRKSLTTVKFS